MIKKLLILLLILFVLLPFGCKKDTSDGGGKYSGPRSIIRIGVANITQGPAYFLSMAKAIEAEAEFYPNIKLINTDANGDGNKLTEDIKGILTQDVDGIIISAGWIEEAPEALNAIKEAGVPVVLVDTPFKNLSFNKAEEVVNLFIFIIGVDGIPLGDALNFRIEIQRFAATTSGSLQYHFSPQAP